MMTRMTSEVLAMPMEHGIDGACRGVEVLLEPLNLNLVLEYYMYFKNLVPRYM